MKLKKINIERFRSFNKFNIDDFEDLNLIVGKNNSGKTSLLEAIFLSIGISNPGLALNIDGFRGLIHDDIEDFRFIFHNLDYSNNISIESNFIENTQNRKLEIKPSFEKSKIVNKSTKISGNTNTSINNINGIEFNFSVSKSSKERNIKKSILKITTTGGIEITQPEDYVESGLGIYLRPTIITKEIYDRLDKILIKKGEEKLLKSLHHIDNRIADISLGANNMIYFDIGIDRLIPINIMGDGLIRLLSILATIANAENGIVLIDEIENGFHYSVLNKLWESIFETAKYYNVQIFATTHSLECAKAFNNIQTSKLLREDTLRLFRIENIDNQFEVFKYDSQILESTFESNWEIR